MLKHIDRLWCLSIRPQWLRGKLDAVEIAEVSDGAAGSKLVVMQGGPFGWRQNQVHDVTKPQNNSVCCSSLRIAERWSRGKLECPISTLILWEMRAPRC